MSIYIKDSTSVVVKSIAEKLNMLYLSVDDILGRCIKIVERVKSSPNEKISTLEVTTYILKI